MEMANFIGLSQAGAPVMTRGSSRSPARDTARTSSIVAPTKASGRLEDQARSSRSGGPDAVADSSSVTLASRVQRLYELRDTLAVGPRGRRPAQFTPYLGIGESVGAQHHGARVRHESEYPAGDLTGRRGAEGLGQGPEKTTPGDRLIVDYIVGLTRAAPLEGRHGGRRRGAEIDQGGDPSPTTGSRQAPPPEHLDHRLRGPART